MKCNRAGICAHYLHYPVILNLFSISYPFTNKITRFTPIHLMVLIYRKYELRNSYSLECFIKIYIGCNLWFSKITPWKMKFIPKGNLPHVKNHSPRPSLLDFAYNSSRNNWMISNLLQVRMAINIRWKLKRVCKCRTLITWEDWIFLAGKAIGNNWCIC